MSSKINPNNLPQKIEVPNVMNFGTGPPGSLHNSLSSAKSINPSHIESPPFSPGMGRGIQGIMPGPQIGMMQGPPMNQMGGPFGGIPNNGSQGMGFIQNMPSGQNFGGMGNAKIPQGMGSMGQMPPFNGPGIQHVNSNQSSLANSEMSSINSTNQMARPIALGLPPQSMAPSSIMPNMQGSNAFPLPGSNMPPFPSANIPVPPKPGNMGPQMQNLPLPGQGIPMLNPQIPPLPQKGGLPMPPFQNGNVPMPPAFQTSNIPMPPIPQIPPKPNQNIPLPPTPQLPNLNSPMSPNLPNVPMPPVSSNSGQFFMPPLPPVPGGNSNLPPSGPMIPGNFPAPQNQNKFPMFPGSEMSQPPPGPKMPQLPSGSGMSQFPPGSGMSQFPPGSGMSQLPPGPGIIPMPPNFGAMQGNFPNPQQSISNPFLSISSKESSISIRIPLSNEASKPENRDFIANSAQANLPNSMVYSQSAGPDQASIVVSGPKHELEYSSNIINSIDPHGQLENQWYYLHENGKFVPYNANSCTLIERAFRENKPDINLGIYHIIFGQNEHPHVQVTNSGFIYRTVRRGLNSNFNQFAPSDIIWYWTDDSGSAWKRYEPEACKQMEFYYQEFRKEINVGSLNNMDSTQRTILSKTKSVLISGNNGFSYMVDFVNMIQINEKSSRWRGIKRGEDRGTLRLSAFGKKNESIPWIPHN
ncbi:hypothetical protein SteCoe_455 [Stentor coeruleus]|uniref:WWE domain-containing protein n=1 Tax=Stentor coeruleus TaxID=5963 RepID=A0A1R2D4C9_9CILI|nr:hypothetical protein SteCoe_455 [Stentor coeruleus]